MHNDQILNSNPVQEFISFKKMATAIHPTDPYTNANCENRICCGTSRGFLEGPKKTQTEAGRALCGWHMGVF